MLRAAFSLLSPAGHSSRLSILIFHRVHATPDPLFPGEPDAARFDAICGWLAGWFNLLPLDEAVQRLRAGTLPRRAACITFDDGYADNHDVALPVLQRRGLNATFFIATGFLDGGRMFNDTVVEIVRRCTLPALSVEGLDRSLAGELPLATTEHRRAAIGLLIDVVKYRGDAERLALTSELQRRARVRDLPDDLMMRSDQVLALHRAGMGIGAHTVNHPILARLDDTEARTEIATSKYTLERLVGAPVTLFAYPNGRPEMDYRARTVRLVREAGFDAAVSTAWGACTRRTDPYQLPRFTPWDTSGWRFGARLITNLRHEPALLPATA